MVTTYACDKCDTVFQTRQQLTRHQHRKIACDQGKCACDICNKKCSSRSSLSKHKKYACPGHPPVSVAQKDKEIKDLRVALEAVRGMGETICEATTAPNVTVNIVNPVFNTDITNIQNNITVNAAGSENIDYIRAMSLDGFKDALGGLTPQYSAISNMFKLVRINEDHPENHNLLLPDRDGDTVHWKSEDGWKTMKYNDKIRGLVGKDIINVLDSKIRGDDRDATFYWGFIVHEILRKCGEVDHAGLKPIYDNIRDPLHDQTMKYVQRFREATENSSEPPADVSSENDEGEDIDMEDVRTMMTNMRTQLQTIEKKLAKKKPSSVTV